jgi:hypothetical protein
MGQTGEGFGINIPVALPLISSRKTPYYNVAVATTLNYETPPRKKGSAVASGCW